MFRALRMLAASAVLLAAPAALAHPVTVDGNPMEWFTRAPSSQNLGIVARNAQAQGELIWADATGDARTDISMPEVQGDIVAFQITGNASGVGFLLRRTPGATFTGQPVQVQIAIDVDRVAGSGQQFFAAFADTKVNDNARWEYLVQTLFGSGTGAQVIDTSFTKVADAQVAVGAGGDIEMFVPWSALGLSGPPSAPLRFSVATFRAQSNDLTVDIGGGGISNAVDAITNYGNPVATNYPNSWADLMDGTLDYWLDVWFDTSGEVYAPLLVDRFVPAPAATTSDEWYTVRNVSPGTLPLGAGFHIGDEETVDGTEGMFTFPAGATLAPGATYTIARLGSTYQAYFGKAPDAELPPSTSATIPDMLPYPAWTNNANSTSNTMQLANTGDELLVLDPQATILDVVVYGTGVYPGVTSLTPVPGSGVIAVRNPSTQDTDDCKVDFANSGAQCVNDAACGSTCKTCSLNACTPKPTGTSCSDGNACNGDETCDNTGTCKPGTAPNCNDGNPCTTDACDMTLGCTHASVMDGTSCSDGNACNGMETCQSGACVTSTPPLCDDGNPCTQDLCDPLGGCQFPPQPPGFSCSDGNACNGAETCDGNGTCKAGTPLDCNDGNPCTSDACDATMGCTHQNVMMGTSCADGNACNGAETCDGNGTCKAGTPLDCNDGNPCTADSCDAVMGCKHANVMMGTACSDGNPCNGLETCDGNGACKSGTAPTCDDASDCTADSCDPAMGCKSTPVSDGTACGDANCAGMCMGGTCMCASTTSSTSSTSSSSSSTTSTTSGTGGGTGGTGGATTSTTSGTGGSGGATTSTTSGAGGMGGAGGSTTSGTTTNSTATTGTFTTGAGTGGGGGGTMTDSGCGCRAAGEDASGPSPAWLLSLLAFAARRPRWGRKRPQTPAR
jgi:MYXO-CTERM domain-containing protein